MKTRNKQLTINKLVMQDLTNVRHVQFTPKLSTSESHSTIDHRRGRSAADKA
jgi:hypothetical protein